MSYKAECHTSQSIIQFQLLINCAVFQSPQMMWTKDWRQMAFGTLPETNIIKEAKDYN